MSHWHQAHGYSLTLGTHVIISLNNLLIPACKYHSTGQYVRVTGEWRHIPLSTKHLRKLNFLQRTRVTSRKIGGKFRTQQVLRVTWHNEFCLLDTPPPIPLSVDFLDYWLNLPNIWLARSPFLHPLHVAFGVMFLNLDLTMWPHLLTLSHWGLVSTFDFWGDATYRL